MNYDNSNRFAMWKVETPKTDRHPNFSGTMNCTCPHCGQDSEFFMDAWATRNPEGKRPPISGSVKAKGDPQRAQGKPKSVDDLDIPF